jgi:hypothetical protein
MAKRKSKKPVDEMTAEELHAEASRRGVEGRSAMHKDELAKALSEDAGGRAGAKAAARPRPAFVHPAPHVRGAKHVAGEEPPEVGAPERAGFAWNAAEEVWRDPATGETAEGPPPSEGAPEADNAQILYGLRKEGRLFSCQQTGLAPKLIECDTAEEAREAYCAELRREAGEEPHPKRAKKAEKGEAAKAVALPAMPPGFVAVPVASVAPDLAKPAVKPELVKVVKLAP